ncbi:GAF domain-containing protein [Cellulomonas fimi]|uniref:GAF domain-containing sensor histidine kinase n=1 Tax=Cellulomonas fimi TaxID=1708 RepID=UPI0028935CE0|nr:GAF domain-containing protein [Cellulomonas fimi]
MTTEEHAVPAALRGATGAAGAAELMRAVLELAADLDLPSVLKKFVDVSTELTGARYGAMNILDQEGASVTFVQNGVPDSAVARLASSPHAVGVLGKIPAHGVLRLTDLREHPAFQGFPRHHPPMGSFLGAAVRVREEVYGDLYLAEKPGGFDEADEEIVIALGAAAGVAIENAQLYAEANRREHWLEAGQRITTMLLEGADEEDALVQIASSAREIARADTAALVLPGPDGELVMEIVDGHSADVLLGLTMPRDGRSWAAYGSGQGELVPSLAAARRLKLPPMRQFGPALYAPLRTVGHSVGVLLLLRRVGSPPFDRSDLTTSQSFAAQAALAFVLAEARHAQDVAALLDERERIARDLHDLAIQQLFATGMQLESARQRARGGIDPAELTAIIEQSLDNVDSTVRQIRAIVHALRDPDAAGSLVERLRRESSLARTGLGFAPSLVITFRGRVVDSAQDEQGDVDAIDEVVHPDLADDVVAVVREGLANAARHARASSVAVRVTVHGTAPAGTVHVEVEDDGAGLAEARERHSGTQNLATRARQHGGTFSLGSPPSGRGTLLRWQAPLG